MALKRYVLFAGSAHYPHGGWEDFILSSDSLPMARFQLATVHCNDGSYKWGQIVDMQHPDGPTIIEDTDRKGNWRPYDRANHPEKYG